ncbi:hypothetical protein [Amycolatopsis nalaikhensis]|uniref:Uncharacterized protein n=1 Tax=Amycolatopsis nalaikhensis TaxID=715472 RepID=A0ABY8XTT5_9PSEU|nr:hypothetical protein [Amycolatopsis sp. 2-2]WIV59120.1 hypothetical protein QP939_11060 [Amycolatopsis sp. 2-2]
MIALDYTIAAQLQGLRIEWLATPAPTNRSGGRDQRRGRPSRPAPVEQPPVIPAGDASPDEVTTGMSPHDATRAPNGRVFAANENGRSVAVTQDGKLVHIFSDVTQPAGLAAVGVARPLRPGPQVSARPCQSHSPPIESTEK